MDNGNQRDSQHLQCQVRSTIIGPGLHRQWCVIIATSRDTDHPCMFVKSVPGIVEGVVKNWVSMDPTNGFRKASTPRRGKRRESGERSHCRSNQDSLHIIGRHQLDSFRLRYIGPLDLSLPAVDAGFKVPAETTSMRLVPGVLRCTQIVTLHAPWISLSQTS